MVEQVAVNHRVGGSSPSSGANLPTNHDCACASAAGRRPLLPPHDRLLLIGKRISPVPPGRLFREGASCRCAESNGRPRRRSLSSQDPRTESIDSLRTFATARRANRPPPVRRGTFSKRGFRGHLSILYKTHSCPRYWGLVNVPVDVPVENVPVELNHVLPISYGRLEGIWSR